MASNHQPHQHQRRGASPDEYGCADDDYVHMMDEYLCTYPANSPQTFISNKSNSAHTVSLHNKDKEHLPTSQSQIDNNNQPTNSTNTPTSADQNQTPVQSESRTQPKAIHHREGKLDSQAAAGSESEGAHEQTVPGNPFAVFGNTYPTPPVVWQEGSDDFSEDLYRGDRSGSVGGYGGVDVRAPSARRNCPSAPVGVSRKNGADAAAERLFMTSNAPPSAYAATVPAANILRSQAQASPGYPAEQPVNDDGKEASADEVDETAGKQQELTVAKKPETVSKAKECKRRGLTRLDADGELEWLAIADGEGFPAVRHDDIRSCLIDMAEAERVSLGAQMDHPDEPGPGKNNVTSFYPAHVHWGPSREDRPEILFDWEENKEINPRPNRPGYMYWEKDGQNHVVLDPHDNPVKDWDIPSTIASNIPGYKLEAMRRKNMSLGHKDFWARMPSRINIGTEDRPIWEELANPNSIVNMPMERFRFHAGLYSWTERKNTLVIKAGLKKLYGDKIQDNTIRGFGRDLTTKEIGEIKKGESAEFPTEGDVVLETRTARRKGKSKGTARHTKMTGSASVREGEPQKRKRSTEDEEEILSEEEIRTQIRSHRRARHARKNDAIAAEVDNLFMFEAPPNTIDQDDSTARYSLRSTRNHRNACKRIKTTEELSDESSANEEYEGDSSRCLSPRLSRKIAKTGKSDRRIRRHSPKSFTQEDGNYVPTFVETGEPPQRETEEVDSNSHESSGESDYEPMTDHRFIPGHGDVAGESKGPSRLSLTREKDQNHGENDYRQTAVPMSIGGRNHYASYESLISNGGSGSFSHSQSFQFTGAPLAQNEVDVPQPQRFDVMMSMPMFQERILEEEDTPRQAHRKRARNFLEDEEAAAYAPPLKRQHREQSVLPLPRSVTHGTPKNTPLRFVQPQPQDNRISIDPLSTHENPSRIWQQQLDVEWAQVFEQTFMDLGCKTVNYSEVPPWNEEEVQSLIDALLPTREVYFAWTGEPAPKTDPHQAYRQQFDTIFIAFQNWWRWYRWNEPLPILTGVMHWGRSIDDWEPPSKDSIYFEAFRDGQRAPRGENGRFLDLPGPWLEDFFRMGTQGAG